MTSITRSHSTPLGSLTTIDSNLKQQSSKPTAAIIGTGWAGWELVQSLSTEKYNVIVISPSRTIAITPLLASAAKMEDGKFGNFKGVWEDVFALGDAADILGNPLPTTAEVALQKARWLSAHLNTQSSSSSPEAEIQTSKAKGFQYKGKALVAYLGNKDGVVGGSESKDWTGASAWVAWKTGNLGWSRGWRRKAMLCVYWVLNAIDGREVARR
ncbi:hypothetical protein BP6252_02706 [Coleophoma cylindrospora]|uniref:FAD/NAD(P)-binding domain-containing protein n=1 Tax=Coleophoma cylindrospora TaxID=1849047 RepID=A0A3D8SFQ4_9HELO|nr:hypothetical protein BP6252_02706 [Coleophoma cylindrospora]